MNYETLDTRYDSFTKKIKQYFSNIQNTTIYDKRNIIKIINFENKNYVVKSFKIPHFINKIVYRFFRDSKARRSYENSLRLMKLDISTPKPIGFIEFTSSVFFKESFYISEYFDFDFEIRAVFKDENFQDRKNLLEQFVEYSYNLHNKDVYHIDYSPGNILVKKDALNYKFSIVDVNRMKFVAFDLSLRMKSMAKLTSNTDDNHFMAEYYASIANFDKYETKSIFDFHLKEQIKYLENKKKLKKLKNKT